MELPEITRVEKIDIEEGDLLAVFVKGYHSMESLEGTKKLLVDSFLPKQVKVVIVNVDIVDMKVFRAE